MTQKKKNVTFVIGLLLQGGAERVIVNLSSIMAEMGYDVAILSYYDAESVYKLNPKVKLVKVQTETKSKNIIKNLLFMRRYFKQRKGTIISFIAIVNMLSIVAHLGLDSQLIVADRNNPLNVPSNKFMRMIRDLLYDLADLVVVQTKQNKDYFKRRIYTPIKIIYNPLELYGKDGQALKTSKDDLIVTVGRLMPQKNHKILINAFREVHKSFPNYKLIIYGEGNLRHELEKLIDVMDYKEFIMLPGNVQDVFDKISHAKLFILSSDYEGMPNALIEAMGLGIPVISTRVSGATDLIKDGINGCLIDIGNEQLLAKKIVELLSNENLLDKYGRNAAKICNELALNRIAQEWIRIIEEGKNS